MPGEYGTGNYGEGIYGGGTGGYGTGRYGEGIYGVGTTISQVGADLSPVYSVKVHVAASFSPVYNVLVGAALFPVGKNIGASYNIIGRVSSDLEVVYNVGDVAPSFELARLSVEDVEPYDPEALASFAERVLDYLDPIALNSIDLNHYIGGIGELFQEIEDYARDTPAGPGWSTLMDVDRIPTKGLDWLAQFVGVQIDHDGTEQDLRQQIRGHDRWGRGTPLSIIGPASHWIPGNGKLYMSERNTNPWHITFTMVDVPGPGQTYGDVYDLQTSYHKVRTFYATYSEVLSGSRGDWSKVIEELNKAKPAGIQYTFLNTLTTLYMAMYMLLASYQVVYDDYATYQDLYSAPFPDITLDIPVYRQLISTRYYRNIFNQFQTYGDVRDSFVLY